MAAAVIPMSTLFLAKGVRRRIQVLAVDAHQLVQEGLASVINREEDMAVVATASNGEEAIDAIRRYRPDVVTLDLLLPDMAGEDLARRILDELPSTRIVAITSARGHVHARRALDAGVHGYMSKAAPGYELVRAIRHVQAGKRVVPGPVAISNARRFIRETVAPGGAAKLRLVAGGNGNRQHAVALTALS